MSLLSTPFWSGRWRAARSHWDKTVEYLRVRSVARGILGTPGILGAPLSREALKKGSRYRDCRCAPERRLHHRPGGTSDLPSPQIAPGSAAPFGVPRPVHGSQPFAASKSPLLPLMMSRSACGFPYSMGFKYPTGVPLD